MTIFRTAGPLAIGEEQVRGTDQPGSEGVEIGIRPTTGRDGDVFPVSVRL